MILEHLRQIQKQSGFLPPEELRSLAERTGEPLHRLNEVATFFPQFRSAPPAPVEVKVCRDMACHLGGAGGCFESLELAAKEFGVGAPPAPRGRDGEDEGVARGPGGEGATPPLKPRVHVEWVSCLGRCDQAPAVLIELHKPGDPDHFRVLGSPWVADYPGRLREIVGPHLIGDHPPADPIDLSPLLGQLDPYRPRGEGPPGDGESRPYEAVRRFAEEWKRRDGEAAPGAPPDPHAHGKPERKRMSTRAGGGARSGWSRS